MELISKIHDQNARSTPMSCLAHRGTGVPVFVQPEIHQFDAEEPFDAGHGVEAQGNGAVQEAHDVFHGQVEPFGQVVGRHVAHAEAVEYPQAYLLVNEVVHSGMG